jgi:hypothetical protein
LYDAGYKKSPSLDNPDPTYTLGYILYAGYSEDEYFLFDMMTQAVPTPLSELMSRYGKKYKLVNYYLTGYKLIEFFPNGYGVDPNGYGYEIVEFVSAGFSAKDLKYIGVPATILKAAGCSVYALKDAGFSAPVLKTAGFSTKELNAAGFLLQDLIDAQCPAVELKAIGYFPIELKPFLHY